jgi:hypothetical protein
MLKVIFGEKAYYNQVAAKAKKRQGSIGLLLPSQEPEDII